MKTDFIYAWCFQSMAVESEKLSLNLEPCLRTDLCADELTRYSSSVHDELVLDPVTGNRSDRDCV